MLMLHKFARNGIANYKEIEREKRKKQEKTNWETLQITNVEK